MSHHYHALVRIDHREAKVFHFSATEAERISGVETLDHPGDGALLALARFPFKS